MLCGGLNGKEIQKEGIYVYMGASQVVLVVKNLPANAGDIRSMGSIPGGEDSLEEGMATHSNIFAWRIPWIEEPGGLQSTWFPTVGHNWSDLGEGNGTPLRYSCLENPMDGGAW